MKLIDDRRTTTIAGKRISFRHVLARKICRILQHFFSRYRRPRQCHRFLPQDAKNTARRYRTALLKTR
ncbi:hypothetical protein AAH678_10995 [Sodalis endosymbiont of Spalangia cameroni]|uniref:hypothetical protein n=1 Tax=Sodalis praecaptivus TaxID=1239307 RepID=UPI0031F80282